MLTCLQDLIQMNYLLCSFTPIFLRHVMSEDFQKRFLGIRESFPSRNSYSLLPLSSRALLARTARAKPNLRVSPRARCLLTQAFATRSPPKRCLRHYSLGLGKSPVLSASRGIRQLGIFVHCRPGCLGHVIRCVSKKHNMLYLTISGPHVLRRYYGSLRFKLRNAPNGIWMTQHLDMLGELQLNAEDQNPERFVSG